MDKKRKISGITMWTLLALMLAGGLFVFHNYIFGNEVMVYSGVGSDTKQQYIMWYNGIANRLRAGDLSAWDFHSGLGISQLDNNLTAPFNILIYLIGMTFGPDHIAGCMIYVHILKVLLSGLFIYLFLSEFRLREDAKLIASFLYAFNGYLMVWGQHYMMGSVLVFLPLLMLAIERMIRNALERLPDPYGEEDEAARKKRGRYITPAAFAVALMCAVVILSGYYQGYMVMLGLGIYVTVRVLLYEEGRIGDRLRIFLTIALFMVFGVVMGCIGILPQVKALSASSRLESNASFFSKILASFSLWGKEYYRTTAYRFFGNNLQGVGNNFLGFGNYYEAANVFFSALFVLLLLQYIFLIPRQKRSLKKKLVQYLGILLFAGSLLIPFGSLIFNGFTYPFSRQTFLFMPFFALMTAWTLSDILENRRASWLALILGFVGTTAVYVRAYANYDNGHYETNVLILLICALVMIWSLMQIDRDKMDQAMLVRILATAVFISVIADASVGYIDRDTVKKNDREYFEETYHSDTTAALDWIQENEDQFCRIEKDYSNAGYYMESLAQNYRGVSSYNSTLNANLLKFVTTLWPQLLTGYDLNHFSYRNTVHDTTMSELVGVRYLLTKKPDLVLDGYEMVHQEGTVYVYRNNNAENIASFYTRSMTESEYRKLDGELEVWDLLPETVITDIDTPYGLSGMEEEGYRETPVKGLTDNARLDLKTYHMLEDGISMEGDGTLVLPLSAEKMQEWTFVTAEFDVETNGDTTLYIYTNDGRPYTYYNNGKIHYRINVPVDSGQITFEVANNSYIHLSGLNFYGSKSERKFSDTAKITIAEPEKDSHVTGTIETGEAGIVMLAIPFQEGWKVSVDGENVPLIRADYGFIAFEVPAGTHTMTAQFTAPGLKLSIIISAIAAVVWIVGLIACVILTLVHRHRKRRKENESTGADSEENTGSSAENEGSDFAGTEGNTGTEETAGTDEASGMDKPFGADEAFGADEPAGMDEASGMTDAAGSGPEHETAEAQADGFADNGAWGETGAEDGGAFADGAFGENAQETAGAAFGGAGGVSADTAFGEAGRESADGAFGEAGRESADTAGEEPADDDRTDDGLSE